MDCRVKSHPTFLPWCSHPANGVSAAFCDGGKVVAGEPLFTYFGVAWQLHQHRKGGQDGALEQGLQSSLGRRFLPRPPRDDRKGERAHSLQMEEKAASAAARCRGAAVTNRRVCAPLPIFLLPSASGITRVKQVVLQRRSWEGAKC